MIAARSCSTNCLNAGLFAHLRIVRTVTPAAAAATAAGCPLAMLRAAQSQPPPAWGMTFPVEFVTSAIGGAGGTGSQFRRRIGVRLRRPRFGPATVAHRQQGDASAFNIFGHPGISTSAAHAGRLGKQSTPDEIVHAPIRRSQILANLSG